MLEQPKSKDEEVALSSLIDRLNEHFGTNFTEADQLFFDQIRACGGEQREHCGGGSSQ